MWSTFKYTVERAKKIGGLIFRLIAFVLLPTWIIKLCPVCKCVRSEKVKQSKKMKTKRSIAFSLSSFTHSFCSLLTKSPTRTKVDYVRLQHCNFRTLETEAETTFLARRTLYEYDILYPRNVEGVILLLGDASEENCDKCYCHSRALTAYCKNLI